MTEEHATTRRATSSTRRMLVGLAALVILAAGGGIAVWAATCPCDQTPGLVLRGEVEETPVTDWRFVNDIPLCQIQIYAGFVPLALNLNCMASPQGELFLSCGGCADKFWGQQVGQNEQGRLRLNGRVYPVVLNRVQDEAMLDRAWAARVKKLQVHGEPPFNPAPPPDAPRPEGWGSFHLRSATD
ncbi:MAG: hypothetical protein AB7F99_04860 [Vicinamibacterales bacterium]